MTNGKPSEVKRDSDFSVTVVFPSCRLASEFEREMKARSEDMTNGNSAERERFEKWIGQKRPDESGMEQYSWDDCWSAWEAALSVCADGGKGALGWTWERRYSNGGYTRKFCTSEFEARELAKDSESLSIPDLVYPFFARADGGKGEAVGLVMTNDKGEKYGALLDSSIEEHTPIYTAPQAIGKGEAVAWYIPDENGKPFKTTGYSYEAAQLKAAGATVLPLFTAPQAECAPRADAATAGASIYERFDTWMKGPHARVQTMLDAFAAGASNGCADAEKDAALTDGHILAAARKWGMFAAGLPQIKGFAHEIRAILAAKGEKS